MNNLIKSKSFYAGFSLGIVLIVFINFLDLVVQSGSLYGMPYIYGFPFDLYVENGYSYEVYARTGVHNSSRILMFGLIADIILALLAGLVCGIIFRVFWIKLKISFTQIRRNRKRKYEEENKIFSIFDEANYTEKNRNELGKFGSEMKL